MRILTRKVFLSNLQYSLYRNYLDKIVINWYLLNTRLKFLCLNNICPSQFICLENKNIFLMIKKWKQFVESDLLVKQCKWWGPNGIGANLLTILPTIKTLPMVNRGLLNVRWISGVNFINILRAAFAHVDPKSVKRYWQFDFLRFWELRA